MMWGNLGWGGVTMAATLAVAAVARAILPRSVSGALAVRSRTVDVLLLLAVAAALLVTAIAVQAS